MKNSDEFLSPGSTVVLPLLTPRRALATEEMNLEQVIYIVFDLETTGFSRERNHIIEIAAEFMDHKGHGDENKKFAALVRPPTTIPPRITALTGITAEFK